MDINLVQFQKILFPIDVIEFGNLIDIKFEHPLNVSFFMIFIELGIVINVKLEQFLNEKFPIDIIEFGNIIDIKLEQPSNI